MLPRLPLPGLLSTLALLLAAPDAGRAADAWHATSGVATFSFSDAHLASLGLSVSGVRTTAAPADGAHLAGTKPRYSFATNPDFELGFRARRGGFAGFDAALPTVPLRGGLVFRAQDPRTGIALRPAFLFDFAVEIVPGAGPDFARLRTSSPDLPFPLKVRNTAVRFESGTGELAVGMGDVVISPAWATALGRPELAHQWIGSFDLLLAATPAAGTPTKALAVGPERGPREPIDITDVLLGELYDVGSQGRIGTYPTGWNGLSAATTSCNNGNVDVPWFAPMNPAHPFIGLAMFREKDGALEMIGKNWLKHGFLATAGVLCDVCDWNGGTYLWVGCSDTYSASNNAAWYYLGPRDEINPHTGVWNPCGSFFDATPVDCLRNVIPETNDVDHRLEVHDSDLGNPGAQYYYEGCYYVAGDDSLHNNIGWRECTTSWNGSSWSFQTIGMPSQLAPNPGPVVINWGDAHDVKSVAPDDGLVILAAKTTDLGGGQWHYEYALYNRTSARGIHSFSIPVGTANVTNADFRDVDKNGDNDWVASIADGQVTWSTQDHATNPNAPALYFQTLFNFRFDADRAPVSASATALLFRPGTGTSVFLETQAPSATAGRGAVSAVRGQARLTAVEPNPFSHGTALSFELPRRGHARLSVLDIAGRTVQVLVDGTAPAGPTAVRWDGRDATGSRVASGVYFFRLETDDDTRVTKGTLLR